MAIQPDRVEQPVRIELRFMCDFLKDDQGNIRFTKSGKQRLMPLFAQVGININAIKRHEDHLIARHKARHLLEDDINQRISGWPDNAEFNLMRTALFTDTD